MTSQENRIPNEREFKVILEDIHSQFRAFGEELISVNRRLDRMEGDIHELKSDVSLLKSDIIVVKMVLKTVATKDDLLVINRRLTALENN
ncbi:MAG: hypothetical protein COV74_02100 [Candidatus Omnitrophica bacterium CG11_big_fil_rev_8_21_14_0_20_45_26]|uniref:Uncharacterized protein n=1 Tax=Candidatus Abzuiibacterium crystallinum TaxID=1974748 RepID=A0A2H0LRP1_9BACT|nr:MAG: hypothetical protein COV74_02100 [Candidatus Omnitrophica bacterium CG11_big_fil_rev_8_21_14_0_20_45_26]